MKHGLAVALKPEVPGLDNARMDGPHRNFMDLLSFQLKNSVTDGRISRPAATPGIPAIAVRAMKANRLQPGMASGGCPIARQSPAQTSGPGDNRASATVSAPISVTHQ